VTGAIAQIIDWKKALVPGSAAAFGAVAAGPAWGALAGGLCIVAQACAWIAERMIALEGIKRGPDCEVAILYDLRNKFGDKQK
jgi:hypothetical protein